MKIALLILIICCVGCVNQPVELADNPSITTYINTKYGYQVLFPDEWIGKVNVIEHDKYTQFVYEKVPVDMGTIVSISVYNLTEWEERSNMVCCSSSEITRSDNYVFIENMVLDMPFVCSIDKEVIGNCKKKEKEYTALTRAIDFNKHFTLTN